MADYPQLQLLRASLRDCIARQIDLHDRETGDVAERIAIVATEFATNALQHGQAPTVVQLRRSATAFVVDVADHLPSVPPRIVEQPSLKAGGRGLRIAQELAHDTAWYVADGRKHVWAQFDIPRRVRRLQAPRISVFDLKTLLRMLRRLGS